MSISFAKLHVLDPSPVARRLLWHVLSIGLVSRDEPEEHAAMDTRPTPDAEWRTHELLTTILGVLYRQLDTLAMKPAAVHAPTRIIIEAVQANPIRAWRAAELSALAGSSYSSLRNHFKQSQGETLHEFVQRTRLEQARWRLADPRRTVKEIAAFPPLPCNLLPSLSHLD